MNLPIKKISGHGYTFLLQTKDKQSNNSFIGPSIHYPHPYQTEIESLQYRDWQLEVPPTKTKISERTPNIKWVDTLEQLQSLTKQINEMVLEYNHVEIAVDLEAHSYRTFAGLTCLMQLHLQDTDYLIDVLKLRSYMNECMAPIFANPDILKVMHGADSDILWLQRDFSIYIVNLFDTGRAARALPNITSASLATLIETYVGVKVDKTHQLSDWRQRPLPLDMLQYAATDTLYLLDIYDQIKVDLDKCSETSIIDILDKSKQVCLNRYNGPELFDPLGYQKFTKHSKWSKIQEETLAKLYEWRDSTARKNDESIEYVCDNGSLLRLAKNCPTTLDALQTVLQPIPPLVLQNTQSILSIISEVEVLDNKNKNITSLPSNAFFKPAADNDLITETPQPQKHRVLPSPVLPTEALYKQAGWMTPMLANKDIGEDIDNDNEEESSNVVGLHRENKDYNSNPSFSLHSLNNGDGAVDGKGAAMHNHINAEKESRLAQQAAVRVRWEIEANSPHLLGFGRTFDEQEDTTTNEETTEDDKEDKPEEYTIPKSIKEIYQISNRNRKKSRKVVPVPVDNDNDESQKMDADTLEGAEKILASRGFDLGDDKSSLNKKQRTEQKEKESDNSTGKNATASSTNGKDKDINLMMEIGWIKDKDEADALSASVSSSNNPNSSEEGTSGTNAGNEKSQQNKKTSYDSKSTSRVGGKHNKVSIGAYDPKAAPISNPFFAGAALTGGALANSSRGSHNGRGSNADRKRSSNNNKRTYNQPGNRERNSKTYMYKPGGR